MVEFLRTRSRGQKTALTALALLVVAVAVVSAALGRTSTPPSAAGAARHPAASPELPTTSSAAPASTEPPGIGREAVRSLPRTGSADVYASAVASALFTVDYARQDQAAAVMFWRQQLASVLPAGTPSGTTVGEAQDAAMSTVDAYLPSSQMWATLAQDQTVSAFRVTGVSEPAAWVSAVTSGKITDPGLTARTVIGVQSISYGTGSGRQSTMQTQQLTVAMLCPPTTSSCQLEILPPADSAGAAG